jgi:hypothetical protein
VFIFMFGGSGMSIDIAKCCDNIAGISLGFSRPAEQHNGKSACCPVFKSVKKDKQCCENVVINTVINSVPALGSAYKSLNKPVIKIASVKTIVQAKPVNADYSYQLSVSEYSDQQYPVPILIRKRVLQI